MNKAARIEIELPIKLLSKTLSTSRVISRTSDTVVLDENGIFNIVSIEMVTLASYNEEGNDRAD